jgi:hypothetical protein
VIEAKKQPKQNEMKMDEDGYFVYKDYQFKRTLVGDGNPDPELDNISDGHRLASRFKWRGACKIWSGNINNECMLEIALRFNLDPVDLITMQQNKANSTKGFTLLKKLFACSMIILPHDAKDSGYFYNIQNRRSDSRRTAVEAMVMGVRKMIVNLQNDAKRCFYLCYSTFSDTTHVHITCRVDTRRV